MKKLLMLTVILAGSLGLQGCRDTDVAASIGFIGGLIVGSESHHHRHCHGGYVTRCSSYRNRNGYIVRECREVYDSCARRYSLNATGLNLPEGLINTEATEIANGPKISSRVANLSEKYHISFDAAETIVEAIDQGAKGDLTQFNKIGMEKSDLEAIYNGKRVSPKALLAVSDNLKVDIGDLQLMLNDITRKVQAEKQKKVLGE